MFYRKKSRRRTRSSNLRLIELAKKPRQVKAQMWNTSLPEMSRKWMVNRKGIAIHVEWIGRNFIYFRIFNRDSTTDTLEPVQSDLQIEQKRRDHHHHHRLKSSS